MSKKISKLIDDLKNNDARVRFWAAASIGYFEAKEAVPALIEALKDSNPGVSYRAAEALGDIGPDAKESIPALVEALKESDTDLRFWAASAMRKIGHRKQKASPMNK